MNKEQARKHIESHLRESDTLVGFFQAMSPPKTMLFVLIGPLAAFSMKTYFLAVTQKGLYFHRLSMLGKFDNYYFFEYGEIENVKIGKGILQRPMTFKFRNGRKLFVKAQLKGVEKVAKLTQGVQQFIESNILTVK
jgi:hypothetical protein